MRSEPEAMTSKVPPSERVRVAVCGVRGRGMSHVESYVGMKDVEIVAICDVDSSAGVTGHASKYIEERTGKRPMFVQDFRYLLADRSIDAVSIATTNHWHALQTIWAVQAGKDVYVEKPVCHNVQEGRMMVEAARKYDRVVQAGTQSRSVPSYKQAFEYIRSGKIGKLELARALCYKPRGSIGKKPDEAIPPVGVDYNLWLGPAPIRSFNANRFHYQWHWNWDYGNGDLGNQGIHQMDIARWGIGKNEFPKRVISYGGRFGYEDDGQTPNTEVSWLDWGDRQIMFEVRGLKTPKLYGTTVGNIFHCSNGYVAFDDNGNGKAYSLIGEKLAEFKGNGDHFRNFIEVVKNRKTSQLKADILEGHLSSSLCHLANISYRLGTDEPLSESSAMMDNPQIAETMDRFKYHLRENKVDIDKMNCRIGKLLKINAGTESFENDEKANALLTREYRKPFVVPTSV